MRRAFGACLLLALCFGLTAAEALAQKGKKKGDGKPRPVPVDSDKLKAGEFVGKLKSVPGTDRKFTLEVEIKQLVPNNKGAKNTNPQLNNLVRLQQQIQRVQNQLARSRNPAAQVRQLQRLTAQYQQQQAQLAARGVAGANNFRVSTTTKAIEFQASDTVKVRTAFVPEQFDEKGNIRTFSKEELTALRGKDKSLPGYESSLEKLEAGQQVKLTLASAPRPGGKDKDKDPDKEETDNKKMQVKMILVLKDADRNAPATPAKKGKGKKK